MKSDSKIEYRYAESDKNEIVVDGELGSRGLKSFFVAC